MMLPTTLHAWWTMPVLLVAVASVLVVGTAPAWAGAPSPPKAAGNAASAESTTPPPAPTPLPNAQPPVVQPALALAQVVARAVSPCRRSGDHACLRAALKGLRLRLVATPAPIEAGRIAQLSFLHRTPGTRALRPAGTANAALATDGTVAVAAGGTPIASEAGLWCVVATLPAIDGQLAATSPRTCLRWRPAVTIGWVGDTALGSHAYGNAPDGGRHEFDAVRELLRAPDLLIGNYEGTLSTGGKPRCTGGAHCYLFQAPPSRAWALAAAGFDVLNFANNHSLDYGLGARAQSARSMHAAGLAVSGLPGQVTMRQVDDTRVAIVGISKYPGTTSMRTADVRALVHAARRHGDVVVVTMHAGLEGVGGVHVPRGDDDNAPTYTATHAAIDAGADVVFGSGPHVVRGVERYRGRYIVYSSGNFAGWHNFNVGGLSGQSGVVDMTFAANGRPLAAQWHGVRVVAPGLPRPDRSVVRRVAALSRADFGARGARFSRSGSFR